MWLHSPIIRINCRCETEPKFLTFNLACVNLTIFLCYFSKSYDFSNYEIIPKVIKKEHMRKGYACAAMFQNIWHRGEIQEKPKDEKVKIRFVDYGTIDAIPITDVRYLLNSFCHTPKLCHRGTLDFVKPLHYSWSNEATFFFINLVRNKKLIGGVSEIDGKVNCYVQKNGLN